MSEVRGKRARKENMTENLGFELEGLRSYSCVLYDPDVCGPGLEDPYYSCGPNLILNINIKSERSILFMWPEL